MYISEEMITNKEEQEKVKAVLDYCTKHNRKKFWLFKRTIDIIFSLFAILVAIIPMAIIYLIIFLSDGHDPIFKQRRVGRFGKEFYMYKFRTMIPNAESLKDTLLQKNEMDGPVFKIADDPRITKIGKILRKTSLDELPQFFNVIKGDMTIIGPRPPLVSEVAQYNEFQKIRLIVTPGITCLWQVQPNRNDISFDEWVNLDIEYVLNRNFFMDIGIIFKTIKVMFSAEGR